MMLDGIPIPLYGWLWQRERVRAAWSATWRFAAAGAVLSVAAYSIVLWAQTRGALAAVAALRETGVIVAAIIGTVVLGERFGRRRFIAAIVVAAGAALINLS